MMTRQLQNRCLARCALPLMIVAAAACATNPATGQREFSLMSEAQEIQIGKEMDVEVRRQMGLYADDALQRYVEEIGLRLARSSERPNLPWHFAVVDAPAVNAFALPGGYIYLTRGILPFLNNEAELAGVLGHEIGHVTARHAAQQYTQATSAGVGLTILSIFVPEARPFQGIAETAFSVLFLKHGRDDELQADKLGVGYSARSGWDPGGVAGMLNTLSRLDEANGTRKGIPNWLSTHPAPADRVQQIQPVIHQAKATVPGTPVVDREGFLRRIDGIVFGDSPKEGIIRGNQFLHPELRLAVTFPEGWEIVNTQAQVGARRPGEDVFVILQLLPDAQGSLEQVARTSMANAGFRHVNGQRSDINGLDAYIGTYQGAVQGLGNAATLAAHILHDRRVYLLAGLAPVNVYDRARQDFTRTLQSFRRLSASEASEIRPNRIDLVTVRGGETWESLAERTGNVVKPSTLAIMNNYEPNQPPRPRDRIKVVVQG